MPPTASPKKEAVLSIGLDQPTQEIIAKAAATGVSVSRTYVELLKQGRTSGQPKAYIAKRLAKGKQKAASRGGAPGASRKASSPQPPVRTATNAKGGEPISKSEFIRARPDMGPTAIVAEAKKLGIVFSAQYVSTIRTNDKARGKRIGSDAGRHALKAPSASTVSSSARARAVSAGVHRGPRRSAEMNTLVTAALAVGLDRALEVLQGLKRTLDSYVG